MKYICLGYFDEQNWEKLPQVEQNALMDECVAYDQHLREDGHFAGGEALESAKAAVTLRLRDGKVAATDGPYAETKEVLGGILILEAKDMKEAVELISKHPGVKIGPFEIRAVADMSELIQASEQRLLAKK